MKKVYLIYTIHVCAVRELSWKKEKKEVYFEFLFCKLEVDVGYIKTWNLENFDFEFTTDGIWIFEIVSRNVLAVGVCIKNTIFLRDGNKLSFAYTDSSLSLSLSFVVFVM